MPPIIAHHLLFSSYGFWLANDPRGSNSPTLREPKFEPLGPLHPGRKKDQPTRATLRAFYEQATPLLTHTPLWFSPDIRTTIAAAFADALAQFRYTPWACALLTNHAHLCLRQHRDDYTLIWSRLATAARTALLQQNAIPTDHPLWSDRPYSVYLHTPDDITRTINYIQQNPQKEGLPPQPYPWLHPYTGWPHPKRTPRYRN